MPLINAADQAIRTWKYHYIAGISSTYTRFPMHMWFLVIPQATMTLNMMIPFHKNPNMLEYTALEGQFNFNKPPLAPHGIKVSSYLMSLWPVV